MLPPCSTKTVARKFPNCGRGGTITIPVILDAEINRDVEIFRHPPRPIVSFLISIRVVLHVDDVVEVAKVARVARPSIALRDRLCSVGSEEQLGGKWELCVSHVQRDGVPNQTRVLGLKNLCTPATIRNPEESPLSTTWRRHPALSESIWAHQVGEPGLLHAPKLTCLYRTPSMSTCEQSINPPEAEQGHEPGCREGSPSWRMFPRGFQRRCGPPRRPR